MVEGLLSPSQTMYWIVPGHVLFAVIHGIGLAAFCFIVARRLEPLLRAESDDRFGLPWERLRLVGQFWLGQWKHPRYRFAGILHILIFIGFLILATRAFSLLILGASGDTATSGPIGHAYDVIADYAATVVFVCVLVAAVQRLAFRPDRYAPPAGSSKWRSGDAIFLLGLIGLLMFAESLMEASYAAFLQLQSLNHALPPLSLAWTLELGLASVSPATLQRLYSGAYLLDIVTFYFLLCYRPFGIQFHVETSLFNVYFGKLTRGTVKPVRWHVAENELDSLPHFGVKTFEDFTWKHMLDFYSCADCGRCSDNCPAHSVGRPLSPRFLTTKARDYAFQHYPVFGKKVASTPLVGGIYSEDEIWSCTTCGACEEECPLLIEYIDKIVDLRRGLVDDGTVPKSIQKALKGISSRGNPYAKLEKKRAEWTKHDEVAQTGIPVVDATGGVDVLYFVDSATSYDDRLQAIGRATARVIRAAGVNFGVLGASERDSGHDVRRFGEESLFASLRDANTDAILGSGARKIITADPHAFNALKHDYKNIPPVEHISQYIARQVNAGKMTFHPLPPNGDVYAYHDPCYLGRHNLIYDEPRMVLDYIPGLKRVEMKRCRDRSFCCGGGGLMLFYEPKEDQRMGVKRVQMAAEAGANVIVTACPFCMVNMEDAIKVAGMEGKMTAIDLVELVDRQLMRPPEMVTRRQDAVEIHA